MFLLPLVIAYEVGSAVVLSGPGGADLPELRAERMLGSIFASLGAGGLYLPGVLLVVVLLIWHLLTRDSWRVRPSVCGGMILESIFWTLPLLVLGQMVFRAFDMAPQLAAPAQTNSVLEAAPAHVRALFAVGAGLYEELVFRLMAIALVHAIAADLLRVPEGPARASAVFISAVAFALYHDVMMPTGGIDPARLAVFTFAGVYFGTLYVLRGFGIVVAVHVLYDLAVLVLLTR
ncbi:MAG: CPBP family intramembrane glutamic endopeptidase [Planctomycetota bacterium]|nr:CPBP family intramembrane glutamic endopeptidase [Planctomycetota bacterium]